MTSFTWGVIINHTLELRGSGIHIFTYICSQKEKRYIYIPLGKAENSPWSNSIFWFTKR